VTSLAYAQRERIRTAASGSFGAFLAFRVDSPFLLYILARSHILGEVDEMAEQPAACLAPSSSAFPLYQLTLTNEPPIF